MIVVVERHRDGLHYFSVPEGVEDRETPEQAVVREVFEELGVVVKELARLDIHVVFEVRIVGGELGTGGGPEFSRVGRGTYTPVWMPIEAIDGIELYPPGVREILTL